VVVGTFADISRLRLFLDSLAIFSALPTKIRAEGI
jgi:hypothetical protein